ncbi:MAG: hypothetical protein GX974_08875 [Clostridiales bacterium]|nr:hypothetical protein [Clostridiales bacterium]
MQARMSSKQAKKRSSNMGKVGKIFLIIFITLLILAIVGMCAYVYKFLNLEVFYSGITIDDIDLEGMGKREAIDALWDKHQPTMDEVNIVLYLDDMKWEFDQDDIRVDINIEEVVEEAYAIGREGSIIDRLRHIKQTAETGAYFETALTYDIELISERVAAIADDIYIEPIEATIAFDPSADPMFTFTDEGYGREMLVDTALEDIRAKTANWDFTPYKIPVRELEPEFTVAELKTWTNKIASFSTKRSGSAERKHNIALSGSAFNGISIEPGEIFSFNETTGPRDTKTGYKDAPVIKDGRELVPEPGGGNCQTSSTLYAALIRADVEIVERYPHSWPSTYIDPGQDATVNYPNVDLKVRNNRDSALFIRSYISNDNIVFEIYGKPSKEYDKIGVISDILSVTPAPEYKEVKDPELYEDTEEIEYKSRPGYKVQTYRIYYKGGKEIKRVKEDYSVYPVITGRKRVGTKPKPEPEVPEDAEDSEGTKSDEENTGDTKTDEKKSNDD